MSDITFNFDDVDAFARKMLQSEEVVSEELKAAIDRTTLQGEGFTKEKTPVLTGHLRRSISHKAASYSGGRASGSWGTSTPYGPMVEEGRGPIVAAPGKALVFKPHPKYGIPVQGARKTLIGPSRWEGFAVYKSVKGTKGVFMFRNALRRIKPVHRRELDGAITRIVRRLGGAS